MIGVLIGGAAIGAFLATVFISVVRASSWWRNLGFLGWVLSNGFGAYGLRWLLLFIADRDPNVRMGEWVNWYLGGVGAGSLVVLLGWWCSIRQSAIDGAFIEVFRPLRERLSDREIQVLRLAFVGRPPFLLLRLVALVTGRIPASVRVGGDEGARIMGIPRAEYDRHLMTGLRQLRDYFASSTTGT